MCRQMQVCRWVQVDVPRDIGTTGIPYCHLVATLYTQETQHLHNMCVYIHTYIHVHTYIHTYGTNVHFIPFGVYHRLKGPITFNFFFFIGGVFFVRQKRRFCTLTAGGGDLASSIKSATRHTSCLTHLEGGRKKSQCPFGPIFFLLALSARALARSRARLRARPNP